MAIRLAKRFRIVRSKNVPCTMLARPQDVLPTTLAADESSGGVPVKMVFERPHRLARWPSRDRGSGGVMKCERQIYNALMKAVKEGCVPFGYYGPETSRA